MTNMGWDALNKANKKGSSVFLGLKDGETVMGVFAGDPYSFYQKFQDPDRVEYQKWSEGLSFKFRINFIVRNEAGVYVAKILEGGARIVSQLIAIKEEYGLDCVYKIKRTGEGKETRYDILFKEPLTPEKLLEIKKVALLSLTKKENVFTKIPNEPPDFDEEGEPPFA